MANTFLKAQGYEVGVSLFEPKMIENAEKIISSLKSKECELVLPLDIVCAHGLDDVAGGGTFNVNNCPKDRMILDVGPLTCKKIINVIGRFTKDKRIKITKMARDSFNNSTSRRI